VDTLGLGCILPTTRADWGLSPVRNVRRKAHIEKSAAPRRVQRLCFCYPYHSEQNTICQYGVLHKYQPVILVDIQKNVGKIGITLVFV
ncbi:MAG: hypothetical protein KH210_07525, partial [Roseburia sp.]|nr:hypothetical protein [Roseburia sp.]